MGQYSSGTRLAEKCGTTDSEAASICSAINDGGSHLLDLRQHPTHRIRWLNAALAVTSDSLMKCLFLSALGAACLRLRDARQAVKFLEESLAIATKLKN